MLRVEFESMPFRTRTFIWRLRPTRLCQLWTISANAKTNNYKIKTNYILNCHCTTIHFNRRGLKTAYARQNIAGTHGRIGIWFIPNLQMKTYFNFCMWFRYPYETQTSVPLDTSNHIHINIKGIRICAMQQLS